MSKTFPPQYIFIQVISLAPRPLDPQSLSSFTSTIQPLIYTNCCQFPRWRGCIIINRSDYYWWRHNMAVSAALNYYDVRNHAILNFNWGIWIICFGGGTHFQFHHTTAPSLSPTIWICTMNCELKKKLFQQ